MCYREITKRWEILNEPPENERAIVWALVVIRMMGWKGEGEREEEEDGVNGEVEVSKEGGNGKGWRAAGFRNWKSALHSQQQRVKGGGGWGRQRRVFLDAIMQTEQCIHSMDKIIYNTEHACYMLIFAFLLPAACYFQLSSPTDTAIMCLCCSSASVFNSTFRTLGHSLLFCFPTTAHWVWNVTWLWD